MTVALILGGGNTLPGDVARYAGPVDGVVACNDAGAWWPGKLDAWVTLHPEKFERWIERRNGPGDYKLVSHRQPKPHISRIMDVVTAFMFPEMENSGSSGMFAAKVALCDFGFDHAVLCGIPMTESANHFFDQKEWIAAEGFRRQWLSIPDRYKVRMRSMSGWTRTLLGAPEWHSADDYRNLLEWEREHEHASDHEHDGAGN